MAEQTGKFRAGHQLDINIAKKIPAKMIGRSLTHKEALSLLKRIGK
jgi:hypothetical protein